MKNSKKVRSLIDYLAKNNKDFSMLTEKTRRDSKNHTSMIIKKWIPVLVFYLSMIALSIATHNFTCDFWAATFFGALVGNSCISFLPIVKQARFDRAHESTIAFVFLSEFLTLCKIQDSSVLFPDFVVEEIMQMRSDGKDITEKFLKLNKDNRNVVRAIIQKSRDLAQNSFLEMVVQARIFKNSDNDLLESYFSKETAKILGEAVTEVWFV